LSPSRSKPNPQRRRKRSISRVIVTQGLGAKSAGRLIAGPVIIPCWLGRNGVTTFKREGDGATPRGHHRLLQGYFRGDRIAKPQTELDLEPLKSSLGWCDDPSDRCYNRAVTLPYDAGREVLHRDDGLYDIVLVLDYNRAPRVRGRGSAIFFHLVDSETRETAGCVAIRPHDMRRLLGRLSRRAIMEVRSGVSASARPKNR
jgi:L,D-peptidoglycan transpeptidase YkuD (ErfK/YbiS/YcfS/YnhG family)